MAAGGASSRPEVKVAAGVVLGAVAAGCLMLSPIALFAFLLLLCLVASGELYRIARSRGAHSSPLVGFAAVTALFVLAYRHPVGLAGEAPGVIAAALGVSALVLVVGRKRPGATLGLAATALVVVYVGLFGAFIVSMRQLPMGFRVVLVFGLMATLNDAGSYAAGRLAGRHRMAPIVSPDKTWEGWLGGAVATMGVAGVAAWQLNPPFTTTRALLLGALVAVAAPAGDVLESMLKRDAGVKDAGRAVPGHGGVLDRIDSVLVAAPVFWYAFRTFIH